MQIHLMLAVLRIFSAWASEHFFITVYIFRFQRTIEKTEDENNTVHAIIGNTAIGQRSSKPKGFSGFTHRMGGPGWAELQSAADGSC